MTKVKISACIITYNQQEYIGQCLEGAVNQVLDCNYEIVIGDDCSTDDTFKICQQYAKKYPGKIRLLSREKNLGMARNWENVIGECQGEYIAICEGDDYWTDNHKLQKQINFLDQNQECSFCFHKALRVDANDESQTKIYPEGLKKTILNVKEFFAIPTIPTASVVFRSGTTIPPFYHSHVDMPLYSMLITKGKAGFINEQMSFYRLHSEGISNKYSETWYLERRIGELEVEKEYNGFSEAVRSQILKMYVNHIIVFLNKSRGKLSASAKRKYLSSIYLSKYFYGKPLKEYFTLFKTIIK